MTVSKQTFHCYFNLSSAWSSEPLFQWAAMLERSEKSRFTRQTGMAEEKHCFFSNIENVSELSKSVVFGIPRWLSSFDASEVGLFDNPHWNLHVVSMQEENTMESLPARQPHLCIWLSQVRHGHDVSGWNTSFGQNDFSVLYEVIWFFIFCFYHFIWQTSP